MTTHPRSVIISAARTCFVYCRGCYNHFGRNKDIAPTSAITRFAERLAGTGMSKLTIGGGDPLSRYDIIALLESLKRLGFKINLDTVGTPLLGSVSTYFNGRVQINHIDSTKLLGRVDRLGIPIDGSTDEVATAFRSGRKSFAIEQERVLAATERAMLPVVVNTVVHKRNVQDITNIAHIIRKFANIIQWQLFQFTPSGPLAYQHRDKFDVDDDTFTAATDPIKLQSILERTDVSIVPKTRTMRKNAYLLIDSDGIAWSPRESNGSEWHIETDAHMEREVIGDIRCEDDLGRIIKYAMGQQSTPREHAFK
ncbi:MAG TPA: radical SAM protein [Candidatus Baltobacteraceae bacterium]|jgi:MoaA/NifB/PqqE/SkfB family radical SAM enzyme|nr:radical SAM protein [Candidatus Baltobacteraceae bacterium]